MAPGSATAARAPFSLTASDGTGLALRSLAARVVIEPPLAFTQLELAFDNPLPRRLEGRFEIALPPGAAISRLALQIGETYQEGEVVERQRARVAYEEALHGRRDPALLERDAGNEYRVRVFPIEANATKHLIVSYSQVLDDADAPYRLHLHGLPTIARTRVEVSRAGGAREVFTRNDWQPPGDLLAPVGEQPAHLALRHGDLALIHVTPLAAMEPSPLERLTVLLDTSASSAAVLPSSIARLRELTAEVARRTGSPLPVQLVVFDQDAVPLLQTRSDRLGGELEALLRERGALGATDLHRALESLAGLHDLGDRVWIVSDGIATAGPDAAAELQSAARALAEHGVQRLDVISPAGVLDRPRLDALVAAGLPEAGVVITDDDAEAGVDRLLTATRSDVEVQVPGASWVYPAHLPAVEAGRRYALFARVPAQRRLRVLLDGHAVAALAAIPTRAGALLEREWARVRIDYLQRKLETADATDAARIREKVVELSRAHRVLSDHTALVVLETELDYRRHRIDRTKLSEVLVVEDGQLVAARRRQPVADTLFHEPFLEGAGEVTPEDATREQPQWIEDSALEPAAPVLGRASRRGHDATEVTNAELFDDGSARQAQPQVAQGGIIGILQAQRAGSVFGAGQPSGHDPTSALGTLMGDFVGASSGSGGLGMIGTGHGGAGAPGGAGRIGSYGASHASPRRTLPRLHVGKVEVSGGLSDTVVRRVVRRQTPQIRHCLRQRLRQRPDLSGRLETQLLVAPDGSVRAAFMAESTVRDRTLERCIVAAMKRIDFPATAEGGPVVITQSFDLRGSKGMAQLAREKRWQAERAARERERRERARQARLKRERLREWQARPRPKPSDALRGPLLEVTQRIEAGDAAGALTQARTWQHEAPGDPMALLGLGRAALADGQPELAARAFGSLIDLFPSRADMRRAAGQRLEAIGERQLALAIDSYRRAVALRPDHPTGHRLLALALARGGAREEAEAALGAALRRGDPLGRFPGIQQVLSSDRHFVDGEASSFVRICAHWESDATNLDLHVYDRARRHVHAGHTRAEGGGVLDGDMRSGYGPECFSAAGAGLDYPYAVQLTYRQQGPMGHTLGALHILRRTASGEVRTELRPFALMAQGAWVDLGAVNAPQTVLASAAR